MDFRFPGCASPLDDLRRIATRTSAAPSCLPDRQAGLVSDGIQGLHQLAISDRNNHNSGGERPMLQTEESSKDGGFLVSINRSIQLRNLRHTCVFDRFEPLRCRSSASSTNMASSMSFIAPCSTLKLVPALWLQRARDLLQSATALLKSLKTSEETPLYRCGIVLMSAVGAGSGQLSIFLRSTSSWLITL